MKQTISLGRTMARQGLAGLLLGFGAGLVTAVLLSTFVLAMAYV